MCLNFSGEIVEFESVGLKKMLVSHADDIGECWTDAANDSVNISVAPLTRDVTPNFCF